MPFFLKTYDIAVLLDVSPDDVNAMARNGLIKGHKIGKQWRFRKKDVKKILIRKETEDVVSTACETGQARHDVR